MNQQQSTPRWPYLAIFVCLCMLCLALPQYWNINTSNTTNRDKIQSKQNGSGNSIDDNASNVVFAPPVEDGFPAQSCMDALPQSVKVEPSQAILSQISDPTIVASDKTNLLPSIITQTLGNELPQSQSDQLGSTAMQKVPVHDTQEKVENTTNAPETQIAEHSIAEQLQDPADHNASENSGPTLVANLPSTGNMPIDAVKPLPFDLQNTASLLEPIKSLINAAREQANSSPKEPKQWAEPMSLLSLLDELAKTNETSPWAVETATLVRDLGPAMEKSTEEAGAILDRLEKSSIEAVRLADSSEDWPLARKLRQASFAIQRRLDIWHGVARIGATALVEADKPKVDSHRLSVCLAEVDHLTKSSIEGQQWRNYLLVDAMKELAKKRSDTEADQQRQMAHRVLARLTQTPMTVRQRQFIAKGPVAEYCTELRRWAADPLTTADVLRDIEQYEQTRLPSDARRLAEDLRSLSQSSDPERIELVRSIESHYRNANLRASLTEDLLNRLIPEQKMEMAPVRDTVLGIPVRGRSMTSSNLALRMIPDSTRVRLALEVSGEVTASTSSTSGIATFINDSDAYYAARKPFEINGTGITLLPAEVDVQHETRLRDVSTDLDVIPIFGSIARGVARSQHDSYKPQASQEARGKVAAKAKQRIDSEAKERLSEMVDNLNLKLFGPLVNLSLDPKMIEAQTTQQRMTMRLRIAGEDQLGGFTPRPQAPENCLASFQINESMLNNGLQRLQLDGHKFTLPQLLQRISERFQRPNTWPTNPDYDDLTITFAKKDAATVRCQDGQVILTLNIEQISKDPRYWNNFQVRVFYRPKVDGRSAELARDGVIHLIGQLNGNSQIAIRGIFSRAFPKNETIKLTPDRLLVDPKLQDLAITQFVVDDGWIGFAVGPKQFAVNTTRLPTEKILK